MNKFANQMFSGVVAIAYFQGACVLITVSFSLLRFMKTLPSFVLLCMIIAFVGITGTIIFLVKKAISIKTLSEASLTAFQKFDFKLNQANALFWKTCLPLKIKVGTFGSIETEEFLLIFFGNIILDNTVTLLISTR